MSIILPASGKMPVYRFYVTYPVGSISYEVFPLNFLESSLVDELESDEIFYRRKFKGSLIFGTNSLAVDEHGVTQNRKSDWQLFWDIEQNDNCERLDFLITKTVEGATTTYWEGYFSTSDGKIDIDRCTFEVTPLTDDDYADMLEKAKLQQNILDVSTVVTTRALLFATDVTYTHNRWLIDVIEFLAGDVNVGIKPGVTVSSDFLTEATNPVTLNESYTTLLTIAQKSDIKRPLASNPATRALLSWDELMDIMYALFQVKWNYDSVTDTINVEHVSWSGFTPSPGIDLRTQLSCAATNKYIYLKQSMPKYERTTLMEASNSDFVGVDIWYNSGCVNQEIDSNVDEKTIRVSTDIQYIIDCSADVTREDDIADDGFVILCNYLSGGNYYVRVTPGKLTKANFLNGALSTANLHNCYFRHNRVLITGYMNNVLTTFWTARKTKQQECNAVICDEFNPTESITTELGETYFGGIKGVVNSAEKTPSGILKLNLLYGVADNTNTGIPNEFGVVGSLTVVNPVYKDFMNIDFVFISACPHNMDIKIKEFIYDDVGALNCEGAWNTVTFVAGTTTNTFNHALCHAVDEGWCIQVNIEYNASDIDSFDMIADPDSSCAIPFDIISV